MTTPLDVAAPEAVSREFTLTQQSLDIEVDFATQTLKGTTELQITPSSANLSLVGLHCRQVKVHSVTAEKRNLKYEYEDPYQRLQPYPTWKIQQHAQFKERFRRQLTDPPQEELTIHIPKHLIVQDHIPQASAPSQSLLARSNTRRDGSFSAPPETPGAPSAELHASYAPISISIAFHVNNIREGLHFVGLSSSDSRYPHAFTVNTASAGTACCLFPCIDDPAVRCPWSMSIKCPATLGDALGITPQRFSQQQGEDKRSAPDGDVPMVDSSGLNVEELALEMHTVCSGHILDESPDPSDTRRKVFSFMCDTSVSANQIGFAIGPFEVVDLAEFRELDGLDKSDDDAVAVSALCLPGRALEARNTAMPLARAADYFKTTFTRNPFRTYQMCFVDDLPSDTIVTAGFSMCSTRLLFPEDIIDSIFDVTRRLVHGLASQYAGIALAGREAADTWCVVGISYFMTDLFMKHLCGLNEYRFRQRIAADQVCELDHDRPSLHSLGSILGLDASETEFLALKSGVVLFILDRRLAKSSTATAGMMKIIMRLINNVRSSLDGEGTLLSTSQFRRMCEKIGHCKLETFFQQWVYGAGYPHFSVTQRFNKKKLVVEMTIKQQQADPEQPQRSQDLNPELFIRDVNEDSNEVWAAGIQSVFTGPMTIRIHEADGTPYEHIVEINEGNTKFEIPYNTKYKRLKRTKRDKERAIANAATGNANENRDEALLYCLGDVLSTEDEVRRWRFVDWSKEDETKMGEESYEWIRMDADFEWICKMQISMPVYMFISQLQQDRDVVAQHESLQWIAAQRAHPLMSTFLTKTVMDQRYFHGIRTEAAAILPRCAKDELGWIGLFHLEKMFSELYCVSNSAMARPNNFSDRASYLVQTAIPKAMAKIRDNAGVAPMTVKRFLLDKVRFNDNSNNEVSDCFYVANLISCLADTMTIPSDLGRQTLSDQDQLEEDQFQKEAISEIERYRRIDEWLSSYHNIFSTTALNCLKRLAKCNILQPRHADFLQYTRLGNADELRLEAFCCLGEMGALRNGQLLRYCFHSALNDPSPYMRQQIFKVLGRGLGLIAIGVDKPEVKKQDNSGLIVEEGTTDARQADLARKQTITGAVAALRTVIASNQVFTNGLWDSFSSPVASLGDIVRILDICELLLESDYSYIVKLRLPRYWKVRHQGEGKIVFTQTDRVRTQQRVKFTRPSGRPHQPARQPTLKFTSSVPPVRKPSISLNLSLSHGQNTPTATPILPSPPVLNGTPSGVSEESKIGIIPKTKADVPKTCPSPSPAPLNLNIKSERQSPALDRKSMPPPRNSLVVALKIPRLRDPVVQDMLAQPPTPHGGPTSRRGSKNTIPSSRPSSSSSANSRPGTLNFSIKTGTNGHARPSPSPSLKQEPASPSTSQIISSPPPQAVHRARRGSSVASVSTTASNRTKGKAGDLKRKASTTPTPMDVNAADGAKRRKSTPRKSSTPASTASPPPPLPAINGVSSSGKINLSASANSKKRKSDAADTDVHAGANGVIKLPPIKRQKSDTPSSIGGGIQEERPKRNLIVKLKIGAANAARMMAGESAASRTDEASVTDG